MKQETAGPLRRTRIRRGRPELEEAVAQIGAEVLAMLDPDVAVYPTPSAQHCPACQFLAPCLTMTEGADPKLDLASRFRVGPPAPAYVPRLGSGGGGGRNVALPGAPPSSIVPPPGG